VSGTLFAGRYRLERMLGEGGVGAVWAAVDTQTGERVAIKLLKPGVVTNSEARRRLIREGRTAVALSHPNLVRVHGTVLAPDGTPAILMELLEGESLAEHLSRVGRLTLSQTAQVLLQAFEGLRALHERGFIHRDLKPGNIFLARTGTGDTAIQVKLLDLGLVKALGLAAAGLETSTLTVSGMVVGTPQYMAPEQILGESDIDRQADVFAAGVVLFECLTGTRPTEAENLGKVLKLVLEGKFPSLAEVLPGAPADLVDLTRAMLQREPSARPPDLDAAIALLTRYADRPETIHVPLRVSWWYRARRTVLATATSLVLLGGGAAVVFFTRESSCTRHLTGMVCLPAGTFTMGRTPEELEAECRELGPACRREQLDREQPARRVTLSEFYLDEREVTNAEFADWLNLAPERLKVDRDRDFDYHRFVRDAQGTLLLDASRHGSGIECLGEHGPFRVKSGIGRWPVVQVTWDAAAAYCHFRGKRLPTEAEWERAARGLTDRRFPWGNEPPRCGSVVLGRTDGGQCDSLPPRPGPVDEVLGDRTPEGISGLGGNASEWVFDAFKLAYYEPCGACLNPRVDRSPGERDDDFRVFRGASWATAFFARASARGRWNRTGPGSNIGFRCAADSVREP